MSKQEKLLKRLQSKPKDFTYDEAKRILKEYQINEIIRLLKEWGFLR